MNSNVTYQVGFNAGQDSAKKAKPGFSPGVKKADKAKYQSQERWPQFVAGFAAGVRAHREQMAKR